MSRPIPTDHLVNQFCVADRSANNRREFLLSNEPNESVFRSQNGENQSIILFTGASFPHRPKNFGLRYLVSSIWTLAVELLQIQKLVDCSLVQTFYLTFVVVRFQDIFNKYLFGCLLQNHVQQADIVSSTGPQDFFLIFLIISPIMFLVL